MEVSVYILIDHHPDDFVKDLEKFDPTISSRLGIAENGYKWVGLRKHHHDDKDNVIDLTIEENDLPDLIELVHTKPEHYTIYLRNKHAMGDFVQVSASTAGRLKESRFAPYEIDYDL
jgi:hypothetical protein